MSYLQTTDIEHPRLVIPHDFDVAVAKATVAALAAWTGRPVEFADEQTIQIALSLVDAATAARIRTWIGNDKNKELAFFRHLPKSMYSKHAEFGGLAVVVERIRGLKPKKPSTEFTLHPGYAAHLTDAEITQMAQLFSSDLTQQWWVYDAIAARRLVQAIVDDNVLLQFWQKYQGDDWLCLREMSDQQVEALQRWGWQQKSAGTRPPKDRMVMFEVCRRGQLTTDELTQTCEWLSTTVDRFYPPIRLLDVPRAATEVARDPTANDVLVALVHVFAQLSNFALPLRQWFATVVAVMNPNSDEFFSDNVLLLWAVVADDTHIAWFAERCMADSDRFAKAHHATDLSRSLASALIGRSDGDAVLDKLTTLCKKQKRLVTALENAKAQWTAHRAALPAMAPATDVAVIAATDATATIDWGRTPADAALRIVSNSADPMALLHHALESDDPVAVLNAMQMPMLYARAHQATKHLPWTPEFYQAGLQALERLYTEAAPDRSALDARIGGTSAKNIYLDFTDYFRNNWNAALEFKDFVQAVMVPLYQSTQNQRVKWWLASTVDFYVDHGVEDNRSQIVRLAAELTQGMKVSDGKPGKDHAVTRTMVFVSDKVPGKHDVNRLFGPAIGVTAARWPKYQGKKMQHVITLETTHLDAEAAGAYAANDVAAIAVFMSDLAGHQAFAPNTPHVAIVELTSTQLAKGASVVTKGNRIAAGRLLEPVCVQLPAAVFAGGKKTGALFALRKALDSANCVQPSRSPRWLQKPEHDGTFLFDLDDDIAGELNMGDNGHFYVFADTGFIQSK